MRLVNFKKATALNPKSELASLGLYLALTELNHHVEAINELTRYLKTCPADLYKDTLEELLEGLKKGYMTAYEDDIRNLAKLNGVKIRLLESTLPECSSYMDPSLDSQTRHSLAVN